MKGWLLLVMAAACGSSTQTGAAPDGGSEASSGACPASAPSSGSSCTGTLACEYGADPDVSCDTVATCTGGSWQVRESPGTPCSTVRGPGCPAAFSALGSTCSPIGTACVYPEARCTCDTHCDMIGKQTPFWCCLDGPSDVTGCPSPRPRIGSTCTKAEMVCDYGGCSGNVTLQCTGGTWQPTTMISCPG